MVREVHLLTLSSILHLPALLPQKQTFFFFFFNFIGIRILEWKGVLKLNSLLPVKFTVNFESCIWCINSLYLTKNLFLSITVIGQLSHYNLYNHCQIKQCYLHSLHPSFSLLMVLKICCLTQFWGIIYQHYLIILFWYKDCIYKNCKEEWMFVKLSAWSKGLDQLAQNYNLSWFELFG